MSDAYPSYLEEFSIEIADYNPIGPACHIPLPETMPLSICKIMMTGVLDGVF